MINNMTNDNDFAAAIDSLQHKSPKCPLDGEAYH